MPQLSKADLQYTYAWGEITSERLRMMSGTETALFNRRHGQEVLAFINRMAFASEWPDKASLLKVERMIHDSMPADVKTIDQAWEWIGMNWHSHG